MFLSAGARGQTLEVARAELESPQIAAAPAIGTEEETLLVGRGARIGIDKPPGGQRPAGVEAGNPLLLLGKSPKSGLAPALDRQKSAAVRSDAEIMQVERRG